MSCGMGISWDYQYEANRYDELTVPMPTMLGYSFDCGLNLTDEFDPCCSVSPFSSSSSSQAVANCGNDLPVEFYRLQTAYFRAQLALSHEAQQKAEIQVQALQPALSFDNSRYTGFPFGASKLPEWDCPATRLAPCPDEISQDWGQSAQLIPQPLASMNEPIMNTKSPASRKTGNETPERSKSIQKKRGLDGVPLYTPGGCDAEAAVLELQNMENGFRAETSRRIAQASSSQMKR
ncbi:hypothetical protein F5B22DRAFT_595069 [Xylaria bambusicola]|uniref:uncharacterized protein n=1 Tax=Xylaria bambusicola TaxID=326684 RepID=UPI002007E32A|nr:uncharacterized protein F5B22DRAFT_595069 [Xylaria bambusicola]KAI0521464.1 hypothetical protein F5B22DRAFT_595069 [Xylaria bambusicola]